uniref:Small ribosomal subunit protein uS3c n=1 Tax=Cyanidium sp. THAL103 TaxID=3027999 RepID=A0A9Y1I4A1_9RHOD|nr:ribosomal protein S3 [Cyanidium sp. THAL103]
MGQKINPTSFRLGITQKHKSLWCSNFKDYINKLKDDYEIRKYILKQFEKASISKIQINRNFNQIELLLYTARPGIIVGRSGVGLDLIKEDLQKFLRFSNNIKINIIEISCPDKDAYLLASSIAYQLEKRVVFRRAIRQAMIKAQKNNIDGIKIQVSGRLNGAEIARTEWVREGRVPLQTIRADINYASCSAYTTFGVIGIKVWIFNN